MHKRLMLMLLAICSVLIFLTKSSAAITVTDPPEPVVYAPVFISGFQLTDQLDAAELFNESSDPVNLSNWSINYTGVGATSCVIKLNDWVLPGDYVVAVAKSGASASLALANPNIKVYDSCQMDVTSNYTFSLLNNGQVSETVTPTTGAFVRKGLTKTYRTGKFSTDFITINRSLYAGEWYQPSQTLDLKFSEILINAKNCSPLEIAIDCNDYVKVYNPTDQTIELSNFRIRNGYLGQSSTTSNTVLPSGTIEPGHYTIIPMNVTNGASWLWFEDSYGTKVYDNTVQDYPDADTDTNKGEAWAYDQTDANWKWTPLPNPTDSASIFPTPPPIVTAQVQTTELAPCKEGQYRSEETNRCRSVISAVEALVPCPQGQERNPDTNRCRAVAVKGAMTLEPCKPGQERNPQTNRCRNIASVPKADYAPEKTTANDSNPVIWMSLAGVTFAAFVYAIWEWRVEIRKLYKRLPAFLKATK